MVAGTSLESAAAAAAAVAYTLQRTATDDALMHSESGIFQGWAKMQMQGKEDSSSTGKCGSAIIG